MNILLTSAGRRTYLVNYFKEALNGHGKVYASNSIFTPTLAAADGYVLTPQIYDSGYIEFLIAYCKQNDISAVTSLFDIDLPVLAKNRNRFEENNIKLIVSNERFISCCNDKYLTYKFFVANKIPTIKTYINLAEAKEDIENGSLNYPLVVKPRFGMGSIGVYFADNQVELECFYQKCYKKIYDSYLKYESQSEPDDCVLIQEFIDGKEYGLDIINDLHGNHINTICKKKIAMRAGETDIAETVDFPVLKGYGAQIAKASKHIANLDCDVLVDKNLQPYFLELNCRFGGGYPFSHAAGINLPKAIVAWLKDEDGSGFLLHEKIGVRSYKELKIVTL